MNNYEQHLYTLHPAIHASMGIGPADRALEAEGRQGGGKQTKIDKTVARRRVWTRVLWPRLGM